MAVNFAKPPVRIAGLPYATIARGSNGHIMAFPVSAMNAEGWVKLAETGAVHSDLCECLAAVTVERV